MKRLLSVLMAIACLLSCAALADGSGLVPSYSYSLAEGEEQYVEGQTFQSDVIISGSGAQITFAGCEFGRNIILTAEAGTRVLLLPDCSLNGQLVFDSGIAEGTMETSLPKFMVFAPADVAMNGCYGAVICLGDFEITVDGEAYALADSQLFFDNANPGQGMIPYEGQEANIFVVAKWRENGEDVLLLECEYAPED